jgi:carboxypeptidase family protein/TonB-dependent receptor-like protein
VAPALAAQAPVPAATISGSVVDSLHGRPLVGASLVVDGTDITGVSDSLGRFRLANVPPGTHQIAVYHPLLDTLGVGLYTPPTAIPPGVETQVAFAVPSPATLMDRFCRTDTAARVLVIGRVLDVDGDAPIANATVTGSGQATAPGHVALRLGPVSRTTETDAAGRFHYCLPPGRDYTVTVTLGKGVTGDIPLYLVNDVALPVLRLSRADSAGAQNRGRVAGHVRAADGQPVEGATVTIANGRASTKTGRDGAFTLAAAPSGSQMLVVRHVGFAASAMPVVVTFTATPAVNAELEPEAARLPIVDVGAQADAIAVAYRRIGFAQREANGIGHFVTAADIKKFDARTATSMLAGVPGVQVLYLGNGARVVPRGGDLRRTCTSYYVDGNPVPRGSGTDDDQLLPDPKNIIGMEIYQPSERVTYVTPTRCLTVIVWTTAQIAG